MVAMSRFENEVTRTCLLLGGKRTIHAPIETARDAHDLIVRGLPLTALIHLVNETPMLSSGDTLEKAIGISPRTLQRHKKEDTSKPLSVEQSNRIWRFAKILGRAIEVLGSKEEAELWMGQPAFGLENRKPIDLLASAPGAEAVQDYLTRIEYGIYM
ncbi:type II RES/Xre toxin-antitoxin system antitoxin [Celeribacter halophilus]|uniref:Putative toxin-antitoxin system antitoxin component, TIGR02293 family n=1 Tax=Celeribacter halophilus TaxID=576117 RepID=A0A1I3X872_9RHOB|nr:antitoxin Xre/MbcA/ParS toxin-binding domain-containing protein [Celeribacter halophilus]PZX04008.1 putative toxin-antitoxin system antitoxin component (TIGR02293 family) [Celeribacter halophilus]SFK15843.1 putative toxin-antitoxin system antitoxin component, TIGR02293 family [Celeribacter halophilus]